MFGVGHAAGNATGAKYEPVRGIPEAVYKAKIVTFLHIQCVNFHELCLINLIAYSKRTYEIPY